jgi:hypothetical protein
MSFLKKLFGGGSSGDATPPGPKKQVEHNGYLISATPYKEGGQWQTCGTVSKTIGGVIKEHRFIRADRFADEEGAADHAILKGQQIVDQMGDRIFE